MPYKRVTFKTADGVMIVGDWSQPGGAKKAALLLHMMPATRDSWQPLSQALNGSGWATLAIDLRGHGESTDQNGQKLNYQDFDDAEHQKSRLDVEAALEFLNSKGFTEDKVALVGASIGANLSLEAMAEHPRIPRGVLLSPGLDYRGVKTGPAMKRLAENQTVWLVAAKGDEYSAETVAVLHSINVTSSTLTVFEGADHGTRLFGSQPNLMEEMVQFLNQ